MEPGTLLVFFMATKVVLVVGMGLIVASGLRRWEQLEAEKRRAAAEIAVRAEVTDEIPLAEPAAAPEPLRRAA